MTTDVIVESKIPNVISTANIIELVKQTLNRIGLEYAAPLEEGEFNEVLLKAINKHTA